MSGSVGDNTARASGVIAAAGGGGAWTLISTQTASADTEIDFTTLSADYRDFLVIGSTIRFSVDADMWFRVDAGSGFAAADYKYGMLGTDSGGAGSNVNSNSSAQVNLNYHGWDKASPYGGALQVIVFDVHNTANYKMMHCAYDYWDNNHELTCGRGSGTYDGASTAITGLRIMPASGNFPSGAFTLYGRKTT